MSNSIYYILTGLWPYLERLMYIQKESSYSILVALKVQRHRPYSIKRFLGVLMRCPCNVPIGLPQNGNLNFFLFGHPSSVSFWQISVTKQDGCVCMYVCITFFRLFSSNVGAMWLKFCMRHGRLCRVTQAHFLIDYCEINRKNGFLINEWDYCPYFLSLCGPIIALKTGTVHQSIKVYCDF